MQLLGRLQSSLPIGLGLRALVGVEHRAGHCARHRLARPHANDKANVFVYIICRAYDSVGVGPILE